MNYFVYNGTSSADMGIRIESKNVFSAPKYDVQFAEIPGRHGDLIVGGGRYPNVQIIYSVKQLILPPEITDRIRGLTL